MEVGQPDCMLDCEGYRASARFSASVGAITSVSVSVSVSSSRGEAEVASGYDCRDGADPAAVAAGTVGRAEGHLQRRDAIAKGAEGGYFGAHSV